MIARFFAFWAFVSLLKAIHDLTAVIASGDSSRIWNHRERNCLPFATSEAPRRSAPKMAERRCSPLRRHLIVFRNHEREGALVTYSPYQQAQNGRRL